MKNVGIYIFGLGQSFHKEEVLKYAERLKNELLFSCKGSSFELKSEIINYATDNTAKVVRIVQNKGASVSDIVYTFYEFEYHELLTKRFNNQNILLKNMILFCLVLKKLPQLVRRLFVHDQFNRPYLTFYAFFILVLVSLAVVLLIPATIDMVNQFQATRTILNFFENLTGSELYTVIKKIYKWTIPLITILLLTVPESKNIITSVATEFACADRYLNDGIQSQIILGNLDLLVEYIAEHEPDSKIHFHCYSFGSLIAMDFLFPLGSIPSANTRLLSDVLITIGNPYEFINSYYGKYYLNRNLIMEQKIKWINIYSIADALSSTFRNDATRGEALFGIKESSLKPVNINYEISTDKSQNFFNFITMDGIRMHRLYWDTECNGQSCMRLLYHYLEEQKMI